MKRLPLHILLVAAAAMLAACLAAGARSWEDESRSRKADYVFMEAQNAFAHEDYGAFLSLIRRAYELDSTDIDIAGEWGMAMLSFDPDSARQAKAYDYIRRRYLADPASFTNGSVFANIASHMKKFDDVVMVWEMLDSIYPANQEAAESLAKAYVIKAVVGDSAALDRALAIYRRLEDGAGKSVPLSSQIIRAHLLRADTAAVETELTSLLRSAPGDSYTALFTGSTYGYINRPDSALKYLSLACALDSANGSAFFARANFYRQRGDSAAFDREVFHALGSSDLEVETKVDMLRSYVSELYMDSTQQPRITALFDHLQQLHPGEPEIHALYAAYLYELGKAAEGAEQMSYAVALAPENESNTTAYIQMLAIADMGDRLLAEARAASKRFPQNLYFPIARASELQSRNEIDSAIAVMDSVDIPEVVNPGAVSNFIGYKGDLLAAKGDTVGALEIYDKAISLNPDNIGALNNSAYFMSLIPGSDLEKAQRYSSRAIKAEPNNPTFLDTYAWILYKRGDMALARQYIDATVRVYEEEIEDNADNPSYVVSADIYDHAGDIYFSNGEIEKAVEFWQKALEINPDNAAVRKKIKEARKPDSR